MPIRRAAGIPINQMDMFGSGCPEFHACRAGFAALCVKQATHKYRTSRIEIRLRVIYRPTRELEHIVSCGNYSIRSKRAFSRGEWRVTVSRASHTLK